MQTIKVGAQPLGIAVDTDSNRAYVANHKDFSVSIIDTTSNKVIGEVKLSFTDLDSSYVGSPWGVAVY